MITIQEFQKVDIRVGKIVKAEDFPEAKKPAYKLEIDFGDIGVKRSSAQITDLYRKEDLLDKQVLAVVNFPPKNVAGLRSEVLVLGVVLDTNQVVLLKPDKNTPPGAKVR
jgi:tRNA-binding protein